MRNFTFTPLRLLTAGPILVLLLLAGGRQAMAQVGIGTTTPDSQSALDIQSAANDKGLLIPRLSQTQRRAILNPPQGLMVFQTGTATVATDSVGFWYATGAATSAGVGKWLYLPDRASAGDNLGNHTATTTLNLGVNKLTGSNTTGGTGGLVLSSAGRLGVNSATAPLGFVDIQGGDNNSGSLGLSALSFQYGVGTGGYRHFVRSRHNSNIGGTGNDLDFYLNNSSPPTGSSAPGTGNIQVMTLENNAGSPRVGIGTSTPLAALHVVGNTTMTGFLSVGTASPTGLLTVTGSNQTPGYFNSSNTTGSRLSLANTSGTTPNIWHLGVAGTGSAEGTDFFTLGNGSTRLAVNGTGQVGIGTSAPTALLDVNGSTRLRGLTTAGVVTTDASGNLSSVASSTLADNLGNHTATQNLNLGSNLLVGNGGSTGLSLSSSGRLGLGVATPATRIHLQTTSLGNDYDNDYVFEDFRNGNNVTQYMVQRAAQGTAATPAALADGSASGVSIGGYMFSPYTSSGYPGFGFAETGLEGFYRGDGTTNLTELRLKTTGTPRLTVDPAGQIGIGTSSPTALLDVTGTTRLRNLSATGTRMVTADANGNLGNAALPTGESTTASNGLTLSGSDVRLGGTLTGATTIAQGSNNFSLTGGNVGLGTSSPAARLDLQAGGDANGASDQYALALSWRGGGYRHWLRSRHNNAVGGSNVGNSLDFYLNNSSTAAASSAPTVGTIQALTLDNAGGSPRVGIGTTAPAATLHVSGSTSTVRLEGLAGTGTRLVTTDASGNLGTSSMSGSFVQNQNITDQAADFRISGGGIVGGAMQVDYANTNSGNVTGSALRFGSNGTGEGIGSARTGSTNLYGLDFYTGYVSRLAVTNGGNVGIGTTAPSALLDVNGSTRLRGLAGVGTRVVTTDASGNLGSQALPTDAQTLSVSGSTLSISGGNSVTLPSTTGESTTASNGLTLSGTAVQLGGTLTQATNIATAGNDVALSGTGKLGLGVTAPTYKLHVQSSVGSDFDDDYVFEDYRGGVGRSQFMVQRAADGTAASPAALGDGTTTGINIGGYMFVPRLSTGWAVNGIYGTGLSAEYRGNGTTNLTQLSLSTSGSTRLLLDPTGQVGIGTSTPTATLDVEGSTRLRGLAGTGTRMVTTDASGNLSTAAVPADTDAQTLSISGGTISLTNGGSVTVPDISATNELQTISKSGSTVTLSNGGGSFTDTDTDAQTLNISSGTITISGSGSSVTVPDVSATNELQTISKSGSTVTLSNGGGSFTDTDTDAQTLSLSGTTLSLTNGGSVTLPSTTGESTTASNGLTLSGSAVQLGGTLSATTTIAQANNPLYLTGGKIGLGINTDLNLSRVSVGAASAGENGLFVKTFDNTSTASSLKLEHNGSNLVVRPATAGGSTTIVENSAGHLSLNPTANNVGVGTTAPTANFDVAGTTRLRTLTATGTRMVTADANGNLGSTTLPTDAQTLSLSGTTLSLTNGGSVTIPSGGSESTTASNGLTLSGTAVQLGGTLTGATDLATGGNSFSITGTGNVGIGATATGTAKLLLSGTTNDLALLQGSSASGTWLGLSNSTTGGHRWNLISTGSSNGEGAGKLLLQDATSSAVRATFDTNGNLGLGTTSPAVRLHVAGTSGTSNVRLESLSGTGSRVVTADASGNLTATSTLPVDTDAQALSISGGTISLTNGGSVTVPDISATNELQTISKSGSTVTLSNGGGSFTDTDTDAQTLSLSGNTLSISGGNSVTLTTGSSVTASNGLTLSSGDVKLGGTLTGTTTVAQASNMFSLTGGKIGLGTSTDVSGSRVSVAAGSSAENGLFVGLNGSSTANSLKLEAQWLKYDSAPGLGRRQRHGNRKLGRYPKLQPLGW